MGGFMSLVCFRNGSLAREAVRQQFDLDWDGFSNALQNTPPGNDGKLMLPWFEPELVPRAPAGVHKQHLDEEDAAGHCRAVVEAQMMSMKLHSEWMGSAPARIHVTGGASANPDILQIMADVFQVPVRRQESTNGAALGAALRAAQTVTGTRDWDSLSSPFLTTVQPDILPDPGRSEVYQTLTQEYATFEKQALSR
jgi:xylulokinase